MLVLSANRMGGTLCAPRTKVKGDCSRREQLFDSMVRDANIAGMTWFARALKKLQDKENLPTHQALADYLSVDRVKVTKWLGGSMPDPETQESMLAKMGGDISKALPGYDPLEDALRSIAPTVDGTLENSSSRAEVIRELKALQEHRVRIRASHQVKVHGEVAAGGMVTIGDQIDTEGSHVYDREAMETLARQSRLWHLTIGYVFLLKIRADSDSMAPEYPPDTILVTRGPAVPVNEIPDGTDVILRDKTRPDVATFKRLYHVDGAIHGIPLNSRYAPVLIPTTRAAVSHVVLAQLKVK